MNLIFTATEDNAKKWEKKENQEFECLQDWVQHVKPVRSKVQTQEDSRLQGKEF